MITPELVDYIKNELAGGRNVETISEALQAQGWTTNDLAEAFNVIAPTAVAPNPTPATPSIVEVTPNLSPEVAPVITPVVTPVSVSPFVAPVARASGISKVLVALIIILILAAVGGGAYYFLVTKNGQTPINNTETDEQINFENNQVSIPGGSESLVSIGEIGVQVVATTTASTTDAVSQSTTCTNIACFETQFQTCLVGSGLSYADDAGFSSVRYDILGPKGSGCDITFKYLRYPDPSWVGKEMTCVFDNKIDFLEAITKVFSGVTGGTTVCQGSLYDILHPK